MDCSSCEGITLISAYSADAQQTAVQGMDVDDGGLADDTTDNAVEEGSVALASGNGLNTAAWNCNAVLTE